MNHRITKGSNELYKDPALGEDVAPTLIHSHLKYIQRKKQQTTKQQTCYFDVAMEHKGLNRCAILHHLRPYFIIHCSELCLE